MTESWELSLTASHVIHRQQTGVTSRAKDFDTRCPMWWLNPFNEITTSENYFISWLGEEKVVRETFVFLLFSQIPRHFTGEKHAMASIKSLWINECVCVNKKFSLYCPSFTVWSHSHSYYEIFMSNVVFKNFLQIYITLFFAHVFVFLEIQIWSKISPNLS